jgi:diguanylate cyclase (GGDEF)-like protein
VSVDAIRATNRHGHEHTVSVTFIPLLSATGDVEAVVQIVRDLSWQTRIHALERSLEDNARACELLRTENHRLARTDHLTGMLNRMAFDEFASQALELARRHPERGLGILVCTLDDFRALNDAHGHDAGDAMLMATAQVLTRIVRAADRVARFGGETFVVLLPEVSLDGLHVVGDRCCHSIRTMPCPPTIHGKSTPQTASVGAAWFPAHGETIEALLLSAHEAATRAQHDGKNTFRCAQ